MISGCVTVTGPPRAICSRKSGTTLPADPPLQTWVKRKDLAGYDAYTLQQGEGAWLLLCAQNKGRCYFRRLG